MLTRRLRCVLLACALLALALAAVSVSAGGRGHDQHRHHHHDSSSREKHHDRRESDAPAPNGPSPNSNQAGGPQSMYSQYIPGGSNGGNAGASSYGQGGGFDYSQYMNGGGGQQQSAQAGGGGDSASTIRSGAEGSSSNIRASGEMAQGFMPGHHGAASTTRLAQAHTSAAALTLASMHPAEAQRLSQRSAHHASTIEVDEHARRHHNKNKDRPRKDGDADQQREQEEQAQNEQAQKWQEFGRQFAQTFANTPPPPPPRATNAASADDERPAKSKHTPHARLAAAVAMAVERSGAGAAAHTQSDEEWMPARDPTTEPSIITLDRSDPAADDREPPSPAESEAERAPPSDAAMSNSSAARQPDTRAANTSALPEKPAKDSQAGLREGGAGSEDDDGDAQLRQAQSWAEAERVRREHATAKAERRNEQMAHDIRHHNREVQTDMERRQEHAIREQQRRARREHNRADDDDDHDDDSEDSYTIALAQRTRMAATADSLVSGPIPALQAVAPGSEAAHLGGGLTMGKLALMLICSSALAAALYAVYQHSKRNSDYQTIPLAQP